MSGSPRGRAVVLRGAPSLLYWFNPLWLRLCCAVTLPASPPAAPYREKIKQTKVQVGEIGLSKPLDLVVLGINRGQVETLGPAHPRRSPSLQRTG